jgi:hypothetical protein
VGRSAGKRARDESREATQRERSQLYGDRFLLLKYSQDCSKQDTLVSGQTLAGPHSGITSVLQSGLGHNLNKVVSGSLDSDGGSRGK